MWQSSKDEAGGVYLHAGSGVTFLLELDSGALKVSMWQVRASKEM